MIVGGLIDVFASSFLGAVSVVFVLLLLSIAHTPADDVSGAVAQIVRGPFYSGAQIVIGAGCSLLGGYIAARLARHDERLNGAVSSIISVVSGIVSIVVGHDPAHLTLQLVILPVKPVLGYAGGYLRQREVRLKLAARR